MQNPSMQSVARPADWNRWVRGAKTALKFAAIYLIVDFALNRFAFSDGWTIVWPLNGVNVALL